MKKYSHSLVLACALVFGLVSATKAATFVVSGTTDTYDENMGDGMCADSTGVCTLRAAVDEANAYAGSDTITFSVDGTFSVQSFEITESLTITGNGSDVTVISISLGSNISAGATATLANLELSFSGSAVLSNLGSLSLSNGSVTGLSESIQNSSAATLTLTECTVSDSVATAINNAGTLNITRSTLAGNSDTNTGTGGAINNSGTANIVGSTLNGNSASESGGAIYNTGFLSLSNSTFGVNQATQNGGGIYNSSAGTVNLYNVTIFHNAIMSGAGGGIYNDVGGTIRLRNSVIALNDDFGGGYSDCYGTLTQGNYNLIGDTTDCTVTALTNTLTGDPGLVFPMADNGGSTLTYALESDSQAVDAGNPSGCLDSSSVEFSTDQRGSGFARAYNSRCDLGAFEYIGTETSCTDGIDEDNDGDTDCDDSECVTSTTMYYADADDDTYGDASVRQLGCQPSGYVTNHTDCDDTSEEINPAATEYCDSVDNDCNGVVDDDNASDASTWYLDDDSDGYGDSGFSTISCDAPTDYVADGTDCDDYSASIYPDATEVDDDVDNDCDGEVDEGCGTTYYADADEDTYGDAGVTQTACSQPTGYVSDSSDCDDDRADIHSGIPESCDNTDNNCDGQIDEGLAVTYYYDGDNDNYGTSDNTRSTCHPNAGADYITTSGDCDDADNAANPGATETCGDGTDQDCDGLDLACVSETTADDDVDGVADTTDNCPLLANADQLDTDSDNAGNVCDDDDDGDGVADTSDAFALDASETTDTDNDGVGDVSDVDDDGDGLLDAVDTDDDGDGVADTLDDSDGDGIVDADDLTPTVADAPTVEGVAVDDAGIDSDAITVDATTPVVEGTGIVGDDDGVDGDGNAGTGGGGGGCSLNASVGAMPSFSLLLFFLPVFLMGMLLVRKRTKVRF